MSLAVKIIDETMHQYYKKKRAYSTDSGFDLYSKDNIEILPNQIAK